MDNDANQQEVQPKTLASGAVQIKPPRAMMELFSPRGFKINIEFGDGMKPILQKIAEVERHIIKLGFRPTQAVGTPVNLGLQEKDFQPPEPAEPNLSSLAQAQAQAMDIDPSKEYPHWCCDHDVPLHKNNRDGSVWYSHKHGDGFCKGRWCDLHNVSFVKRKGKGGQEYWSHSYTMHDGSKAWCSPKD